MNLPLDFQNITILPLNLKFSIYTTISLKFFLPHLNQTYKSKFLEQKLSSIRQKLIEVIFFLNVINLNLKKKKNCSESPKSGRFKKYIYFFVYFWIIVIIFNYIIVIIIIIIIIITVIIINIIIIVIIVVIVIIFI